MNAADNHSLLPLIVCADDAGFAERSDHAILRAFEQGIVCAASVAVTQPRAERFVQEAREVGLEVGLHLDLTEGPPLTGALPGLSPDGASFLRDKPATWALLLREPEPELAEAIEAEIAAQWAQLLAWGAQPSHLNGHNHMHVLPGARHGLLRLLAAQHVPFVRVPLEWTDSHEHPSVFAGLTAACGSLAVDLLEAGVRTAGFTGYAFSDSPTSEQLLASVGGSRALELMVHPGARPGSSFTDSPKRDDETQVLTDPALPDALAARGFVPMCFVEALQPRSPEAS